MPELNFILSAAGASAQKTTSEKSEAGSANGFTPRILDSGLCNSEQPVEKFQTVMERIAGLCSNNFLQPKLQTGQVILPVSLSPKSDETGKTDSDTAVTDAKHDGHSSAMPIDSDLTMVPEVSVAAAGIMPIIAELSPAGAPVTSAKSADFPPNQELQPVKKSKSSAGAANHSAIKKAAAGLMPATAKLSQLICAAVQIGQLAKQTDFSAAPAKGQIHAPVPSTKVAATSGAITLLETEFLKTRGKIEPFAPVKQQTDLSEPKVKAAAIKGVVELPEALFPNAAEKISSTEPAAHAKTPVAIPSAGEIAQIGGKSATIIIKVSPSSEPALISKSPQSSDGTVAAKQDATMKMAAKKTNFSDARQKLPGAATVPAGENLPVRSERAAATAPAKNRGEPVSAVGAGIPANAAAAKVVSSEATDLPHLVPANGPFVQRAQELVSLQVMRLHETGADELRVVIKPDTGTQLSLNLQQRNGSVEVQAVLDRGNFDLLNRHWPELQQQLEARGVRVAPLSSAEHFFGGGSQGFRQPTTHNGQHSGDDAELAEAPATLVPGLPTATATASASATLARNWETWA